MATPTFDALAYFEKPKAAGVPEERTKIQANAVRDFSAIREENNRKKLAAKGDSRETESRFQMEIEKREWKLNCCNFISFELALKVAHEYDKLSGKLSPERGTPCR